MKLTAFILLIACLGAAAKGDAQTVTLSLKNVPVQTVFREVIRQTGVSIIYNEDIFQDMPPVSVQVKNATVKEVLDNCLSGQSFTYSLEGNKIIITKKLEPALPTEALAQAAPIDITGRVTDADGNPLVGATVKVKGTGKGTTTNTDGVFTLKGVDDDAVLEISYVGFLTQTISINSRTSIVLSLKRNESPLDQVQIIAYGTTTKRLSTGNVNTVNASDIEKQPVNNPLLALEGRVPGLFITQNTGIAGGGVTVRIQGEISLLSGSDPLYVVDGVPYNSQNLPDILGTNGILGFNGNNSRSSLGGGSPLSYINPSDIESIEILKDADATSIYGSRAAAGAILITTKKGKSGKTSVEASFEKAWGKVAGKLKLLNTDQYLQMRKEAYFKNDGLTTSSPRYLTSFDINGTWDTTRYTDWQNVLIGNTCNYYDAHVSLSGGNDFTQFLIGGTYHRETAVFPGDFADTKNSVHFNLNHLSANKKLHFNFTGNYLIDDNKLPGEDLTNYAIKLAPVAPALYNSDGSLNWAPLPNGNSSWYNPLAYTNAKYSRKVNNLISNAVISYDIITGLTVSTNLGYSNQNLNEKSVYPLSVNAPELQPTSTRYGEFGDGSVVSTIAEPQISYKRKFEVGSFDFLIGGTFLKSENNAQQIFGSGFSSDLVMEDIKSAPTVVVSNTLLSTYRYNAVFGRLNYNYRNKYILNLSARRDGSSRFGSENLFHNFGSIGGSWIFSNEKFIADKIKFLSFGKIKGSYGNTGNDQIGDYQFMGLYNAVSAATPYQGATGLATDQLTNSLLQWEETRKLSLGAELGFLNDNLLFSSNYFLNRSSNLLQSYTLPNLTGFTSIMENFPATIQNSGLELGVDAKIISSKKFRWTTSINLTLPKNKLVKYQDLEKSSVANSYVLGEPIPIGKSYKMNGVDPVTGLFTFIDSKGTVTSHPVFPTDLTVLNNGFPSLYGGIQNNLNYRHFELSVLFQFVRQKGPNYSLGNRPGAFTSNNFGTVRANQPLTVFNRWQKPGDIATFQKFSVTYPADAGTAIIAAGESDAAFSDASFGRVKNLYLSWQLPDRIKNRLHIQNATIFVQGQNLFTFSNYQGLDPETKSINNLPPLKVITAGLKIKL
jgi:TonB-linked SusC/RagA family outer membrane protein